MWFVGLGVLLGLLKLLDIGPTSAWSWLVVLAPFGLAVIWWAWADLSGYTKRRQMDKMEARKIERRNQNLSALGIDPRAYSKQKSQADKFKAQMRKQVDQVEGKREAQRKKFKDSIRSSRLDSKMGGFDSTRAPGPGAKGE